MTIKSRLFASVAVPFFSLPLMLQSASALPLVAPGATRPDNGLMLVQQRILPPDGQPEGEGQPSHPEQPPREEEQKPDQEQHQRPPEQERAPEPPPREEAPAPEPERREAPAQQEQPPQPEPGQRPEPAQPPVQEDKPEPPPPPAPEAPAPEAPAPAPEPQPQPEAREPAPPPSAPPAQENAPQPAPPQESAPEAAPGGHGNAQEPGRRPDRQRDAPRPDAGHQAPPAEAPAQEAPASPPPSHNDATAPAAPAAPEQAQPAAPPRTPEEIRRAEELARDPTAAHGGETIVLPVENGAAVLDSAKEDAPRDHGGRNGNRPGGERPDRGRDTAAPQPPPPPPGEIHIPQSDAAAQVRPQDNAPPIRIEPSIAERGERIDRRPEFERPRGWDELDRGRQRRDDGRVIFEIDNRTVIRHDDSRRFYEQGDAEPEYERLRGGRTREIVERRDGTQVVTIRNRYGEIIQRSRIARDGEEYVLYYAPELMEERPDRVWRDPGLDLPPMRLTVPLDDYIIDTSSDEDRDYYRFLEQPPVERVERVYSLDEVRYSARIRDKVRRIDLDTITFDTGSAEVPMSQAKSLRRVADAINKVLEKNPAETFLIEGHTDAVGSDDSNLVLSDRRAESVAMILTDTFGIPPENMATQGYGERYLKVRTEGPSQENRRVTIRRITPLVRPVAAN